MSEKASPVDWVLVDCVGGMYSGGVVGERSSGSWLCANLYSGSLLSIFCLSTNLSYSMKISGCSWKSILLVSILSASSSVRLSVHGLKSKYVFVPLLRALQ